MVKLDHLCLFVGILLMDYSGASEHGRVEQRSGTCEASQWSRPDPHLLGDKSGESTIWRKEGLDTQCHH